MAQARNDPSGNEERARRQLAQERQRSRTMEAAARRNQQEIARLRERLGRTEAALRTEQVEREVADLELILVRGLRRSPHFDWASYQRRDEPEALDLGADATPRPRPVWAAFAPQPGTLGTLLGTLPGSERVRGRRESTARQRFEQALREHELSEAERLQRIRQAEADHQARVAEHRSAVEAHNRGWTDLHAAVRARDPAGVARFLGFVLGRLPLPDGFPRAAEVACTPDGEQADVRAALPTGDAVRRPARHTHSSDSDLISAEPRPDAEVAALHRSVAGQVALLQLRELFGADPGLRRVVLTGCAGEGADAPVLVRIAADRQAFAGVGPLSVPDAGECLRLLGAQWSG